VWTAGTHGATCGGPGPPGVPTTSLPVAFRRGRLHGGVWAGYLAGGVLGAFLALHWDLWSLTLPLAALLMLIVVDFARRA
jgi:hypothetical protein